MPRCKDAREGQKGKLVMAQTVGTGRRHVKQSKKVLKNQVRELTAQLESVSAKLDLALNEAKEANDRFVRMGNSLEQFQLAADTAKRSLQNEQLLVAFLREQVKSLRSSVECADTTNLHLSEKLFDTESKLEEVEYLAKALVVSLASFVNVGEAVDIIREGAEIALVDSERAIDAFDRFLRDHVIRVSEEKNEKAEQDQYQNFGTIVVSEPAD